MLVKPKAAFDSSDSVRTAGRCGTRRRRRFAADPWSWSWAGALDDVTVAYETYGRLNGAATTPC